MRIYKDIPAYKDIRIIQISPYMYMYGYPYDREITEYKDCAKSAPGDPNFIIAVYQQIHYVN